MAFIDEIQEVRDLISDDFGEDATPREKLFAAQGAVRDITILAIAEISRLQAQVDILKGLFDPDGTRPDFQHDLQSLLVSGNLGETQPGLVERVKRLTSAG